MMGWRECCTTSFCNCCLASNIDLHPHFDPFCVWGNEIFMNQHQVRKLIKIVIKMGQKMSIKLFDYTLCKTTVNCRMVSKNFVAFFLLLVMSYVRRQCLNHFPLQWILKQITQDYLSNYMIHGRPSQGVGLESCVPSASRRA